MRALVVAGGGMRCAYASGALETLQARGAEYDAVYGTSAGGAMVTWFGAGQADRGTLTWPWANDVRALSWRRFLTRSGPLIDLDFLYDHVYPHEVGLDLDAVHSCPHPIWVTAADVDGAIATLIDVRRTDTLEALKATSSLPVACRSPIHLDGKRYMDGGVLNPIPLTDAIDAGASDITLLVSDYPGKFPPQGRLVRRWFRKNYPTLYPAMRHHDAYVQEAERLAQRPPEGITVRTLRPSHPLDMHRFTRRPSMVQYALDLGRQDAKTFKFA